jgi:hypothetical protein
METLITFVARVNPIRFFEMFLSSSSAAQDFMKVYHELRADTLMNFQAWTLHEQWGKYRTFSCMFDRDANEPRHKLIGCACIQDTVVVRAAVGPPSSRMEERHRYNLQPYVMRLIQ